MLDININTLLETIDNDTIVQLVKDGKILKENRAVIVALDWLNHEYDSMKVKNNKLIINVK